MEHPYKKLVDNIINDSEKDKLPRLLELARRCGNDNYILFRIAEYKFKYGTHFINLLGLWSYRNGSANTINYIKNVSIKEIN